MEAISQGRTGLFVSMRKDTSGATKAVILSQNLSIKVPTPCESALYQRKKDLSESFKMTRRRLLVYEKGDEAVPPVRDQRG